MRNPAKKRTSMRVGALVAATALTLSACGGGDTDEPPEPGGEGGAAPAGGAPDAGEEEEAPEAGDISAESMAGDGDVPEFDLSGMEITFTTSQPGALNMGTFWMFDKLREWGAEVEEVILTTTTGIQTLVAGESDAGAHGGDEAVLGAAEGADVVAIGAPNSRMDYVLVGGEEIETIEDLEGGTIAMSGPAGFDALLSRLALEEAGMDPDGDVNFVQIGGSPERGTALLTGNADAATIFLEDWFEVSQRAEDLNLVTYMAELFPQFPADVFYGNTGYWEENPDMATAVACANLEANSWINSNREQFIEFTLERAEGTTEEGIGQTYDAAQEVGMFPEAADEILTTDGFSNLSEAMEETGDISSGIDANELVDTSYLEEAESMGCGPS